MLLLMMTMMVTMMMTMMKTMMMKMTMIVTKDEKRINDESCPAAVLRTLFWTAG